MGNSWQVLRIWAPLLDCMLEPLGLPAGANRHQVAAKLVAPACRDADGHGDQVYNMVLADGTETLLRFRVAEAS